MYNEETPALISLLNQSNFYTNENVPGLESILNPSHRLCLIYNHLTVNSSEENNITALQNIIIHCLSYYAKHQKHLEAWKALAIIASNEGQDDQPYLQELRPKIKSRFFGSDEHLTKQGLLEADIAKLDQASIFRGVDNFIRSIDTLKTTHTQISPDNL